MAIDVKLPELGENIEAGDVAAVLVSPGDQVEKDAPLVELETDKAVVEVPAPEAGVVTAIHVKAGDTINVGDTIASLESAAGGTGSPAAPSQPADEPPAVVSSPEPAAPPAGSDSGTALAPAPAPAPPPAQPEVAAAAEEPSAARPIPATPAVRRLAREIGVDIDAVTGTGPGGRILLDDVKATAKRLLQAPVGRRTAGRAAPPRLRPVGADRAYRDERRAPYHRHPPHGGLADGARGDPAGQG